ncbi:helix-turn-helix domain-containing protein [Micromonospora matsumotoense]|uniref:helix-turn-helix domain-containing protein n=1 Tax=Micromonospora matsumotoense TaxID=121616 RepID=UPI000B891461|nr:helix-turn-helix transcriptional regulator [Micromonospora matsumotoense]
MNHDDDPARLRGRILRAYRLRTEVAANDLATRIGVAANVLSQWESGVNVRRAARQRHIAEDVATALRLSADDRDALLGLWAASGTIALAPRPQWSHNYPPGGAPAWVWLRRPLEHRPGRRVHLWYSEPLQVTIGGDDIPAGGLILQAPASFPNPPLECRFDEPGWASFGIGIVTADIAEQLDVRLVEARDLAGTPQPRVDPRLRPEDERLLDRAFGMLRRLAEGAGVAWALLAPHVGIASPAHPPHPRPPDADQGWLAALRQDPQGLVTQPLTNGADLRALRGALGQSRADTAAAVTDLGEDALTVKSLEHWELDGRLPAAPRIISRLDTVLQADGHLGIERTSTSAAAAPDTPVVFPAYWRGPVWVQLIGPAAAGDDEELTAIEVLLLRWPPWQRRQEVRSGDVLTTRCAGTNSGPLSIHPPAGWGFAAGTGHVPGAIDINHGWHPVSLRAASWLIITHIRMILNARRHRG